ncbi:hypothetical protein B0H19DRAFT_1083146 [Mycena capillaripes]|nr:hypothetical protein B0H19DRAFT_1083146 [Mycena capillaripes]
MPPKPTSAESRLKSITVCMAVTTDTVETLATALKAPFLEAIAHTTRSLLKNIQNKDECARLMETTYQLLEAVLIVHIDSDTGRELPPSVSNHIGKFTRYWSRIPTQSIKPYWKIYKACDLLWILFVTDHQSLGPVTKFIPLLKVNKVEAKSKTSSVRVK